MDRRDEVLRRQQQHIDQYGWSVTHVHPRVGDPGTSFAYTVGLTEHGYPELLMAGLGQQVTHRLLNDMAQRVFDRAERFDHGQQVADLLAGYLAVVVHGETTDTLFPGAAIGRYGADRVQVQQIVWPDPDGRFPWQDGYAYPVEVQPLLTMPSPPPDHKP